MRKKTAPRTRKHRETSSSKKLGLIAREKNAQQSAVTKSALDNRFHRTALPISCGVIIHFRSLLGGVQRRQVHGLVMRNSHHATPRGRALASTLKTTAPSRISAIQSGRSLPHDHRSPGTLSHCKVPEVPEVSDEVLMDVGAGNRGHVGR